MTKDKNKTTFLSCNTLGNDLKTIIIVALFSLLYRSAAADGGNSPPSDSYGFNGNFNPSIAIIIVVLVSAFFFMGFFSIYIRQCAGESETVRQPNIGRSRRGARGLDSAVIETFPTFIYSVVKGLKLGKNTLECAVCLSEFQDEETLRLLPKCNHVFHPDCIDAWLTSHTTCPVCRANLELGPEAEIPESGSEEEIPASADAVVIPIEEVSIHTDPPARTSSCRISAPPARSSRWSRFTSGRFPRSHSTGHSLAQSENHERYTLRLPENVRKQMIKGKLNRTISCVTYATGEGSSRGRSLRHNRLEPVVKSDRWAFSRAPPFFSRTFSGHSPKGAEEDGVPTSSKPVTQAQAFLPYLRNSFNCLGAGKPEVEEESTRSSVPTPVLPSALP